MVKIVQFVALLLTALSMGVHFGTWLTERPLRRTKSGALFIEVQQGRDQVAARVMPILGNAAIIFVALSVFVARTVPAAFVLSLAGLVLVISDMLVTVIVNVPMNPQCKAGGQMHHRLNGNAFATAGRGSTASERCSSFQVLLSSLQASFSSNSLKRCHSAA